MPSINIKLNSFVQYYLYFQAIFIFIVSITGIFFNQRK